MCSYRQVFQQSWSIPDRTLRPPPEPPLQPNPTAPPPPPPIPVYSWWPRGATLLDGDSAPEAPSVPTGSVTIENAPGNVPDEAPNEAPATTLGPLRTITFLPAIYKGPHSGDYLSPECARHYLACLVTLVLGLRLRLAPRKRYLVMLLKLVGSVYKR